MKIINFGSINIDHVYDVDHFVRPGETLESQHYRIFSGGKGANQSVALARAGATVLHAGKVGADGLWLREKLRESRVDVSLVVTSDRPTGHAVIQVNSEGENAIIIHGGANRDVRYSEIEKVVAEAEQEDFLLLQNEINGVDAILEKSDAPTVVFNPAPMSEKVTHYPLEKVDIFIVNEVEGEALTGEREAEDILDVMLKRYPESRTVVTLGKAGVLYGDRSERIRVDAVTVDAVDTTGAGDTFIGYFLAGLASGNTVESSLQTAIKASALCVTRHGAADAIPTLKEVEAF